MKRIINYVKSKSDYLSKNSLNVGKTTLPSISFIPPIDNLTIVRNAGISIKPRIIYHPAVINACEAIFKKHPDQLEQDEIVKFNHYRKWKTEMGDPLESNIVYLPTGGLRNCLVCGHLT